ncbi:sugar ABC transporter substrate-binding protein [Streptomyces carpinensis]|uniref:Substrate-binding domain-containing protein n=1 Tax=Streptomyces carpinensis TaxID=66369 RepID=A0ABV1VWE7_9ACTN|nr:substrate-binding domain-containing protein [Streptomyces carpinensis]
MAALAMSLAGCGSSTSTSGVGGTSSQSLTSFQSVVDQATAAPDTWRGPTSTPAPPKHIKLAIVVCSSVVSGCVRQAQGMQQAAHSLGWEVTTYDGKGDPSTQNNAMTQAINGGADAVLLAATDPVSLSASMQLAASKKIPVGTTGLGAEPGRGGAAFDIGPDYARWGTVLGSWIVADSRGTADFLPTMDKEFENQMTIAHAMTAAVKKCTGCKVERTEQFVVNDIGNGLGQRIAGALQRNPSVNYVSGAYDSAAADMVPAINNTGLGNRLKLVSCVGSPQNYGFVKNNEVQRVDMVQDDIYMGYAAVDQIIRLIAERPLWKTPGVTDPRAQYGEGTPDQLITSHNLRDASADWRAPFDYVSKFKALWGVS